MPFLCTILVWWFFSQIEYGKAVLCEVGRIMISGSLVQESYQKCRSFTFVKIPMTKLL